MTDDIPELQVDECAGLIELTQPNGLEQPDCIRLHPIHLRYLAERFGLVTTTDAEACKTIAKLSRRIRVLRDRCKHLEETLAGSDHQHVDLSYEMTFSLATLEIADEFCADLDMVPNVSAGTTVGAPLSNRCPSVGAGAKSLKALKPQQLEIGQ
jgi:hypothetical protein